MTKTIRKTAAPSPAAPAPAPNPAPKGKIATLIDLMSRPVGATIADMMDATGWQAHSVRGAISGSIKKGQGLAVISEKTETGRTYRIATDAAA